MFHCLCNFGSGHEGIYLCSVFTVWANGSEDVLSFISGCHFRQQSQTI